jgi:uncharacterized protein YkwD
MPRARILAVSMVVVLALATAAPPAQAGVAGKMIRKINAFRAAHGVPRLHTSRSLTRSSRRWSRFLIYRDYLVHSSARPRGFTLWGEALEMHSGRRARVRAALHNLKASPPHRALLLSPSYRWVGAGRFSGNFQGKGATIWTIRVGRR